MKTCEGCGAPVRLRLTACDYCRREYEHERVDQGAYLAALQAQHCAYNPQAQALNMMSPMMQNQMGAAMAQHYNAAYNNQFNSYAGQWP